MELPWPVLVASLRPFADSASYLAFDDCHGLGVVVAAAMLQCALGVVAEALVADAAAPERVAPAASAAGTSDAAAEVTSFVVAPVCAVVDVVVDEESVAADAVVVAVAAQRADLGRWSS
jgi:hypothetical protein